jgi:hypothetical protein
VARSRNIKPGFYKNEDLAECSLLARFVFPGLWMLADREGRLEDRPKRIKAELLPFDDGDMDLLLQELHDRGFVVRYQNDDGKFIQILKFNEHQSPHYSEKKSLIKPPELRELSGSVPGNDASLRGGRNPLIPDSLNLIPDSQNPSGSSAVTQPELGPEPNSAPLSTEKHVTLAVELRKAGVAITAVHPLTHEWAKAGVSVEQALEAVALARMRKPDGRIAPNYLAPILEEILHPKAKPDQWWTSDAKIDAKARELGMQAKPHESYPEFKDRIFSEIRERQRAAA